MGGLSAATSGSYQSEAKATQTSAIGSSTFGDTVIGSKGLDWKMLAIIGAAVAAIFFFKRG